MEIFLAWEALVQPLACQREQRSSEKYLTVLKLLVLCGNSGPSFRADSKAAVSRETTPVVAQGFASSEI